MKSCAAPAFRADTPGFGMAIPGSAAPGAPAPGSARGARGARGSTGTGKHLALVIERLGRTPTQPVSGKLQVNGDQDNVSNQNLPPTETVALPDGTSVRLRPIRPDDAGGLQAFHARLSSDSVYLRWLSAHPLLSAEEAEALANVDYAGRMAFVATLPAQGDEAIIGVARYAVVPGAQPREAEAAVVVADAYQHRGLGTLLLRRLLAYAQAQGIRTWVAEINAQNSRMLAFIQRGGLPITKRLDSGSWQVRIDIGAG
jgi:RimJ/RimL family protein N-acetyltransferase